MKIRLLIPECRNWDEDNRWICSESHSNIDQRKEMLQQSMVFDNGADLVVTSHNFFSFPIDRRISPNCYADRDCFLENFIIPRIIEVLNREIKYKKPLIIGFDILTSAKGKKVPSEAKKKKRSKKSINQEFNPNPYGGIPAVVLYLKVKNKIYQYGTHIWECWKLQMRRDCVECFGRQEESRYFTFRNHDIGLLSCGDIYQCCNRRNSESYLLNVDIYFDLAHSPLPAARTINSIHANLIGFTNYLFVTHQVRRERIRHYCMTGNYPWIFPRGTNHHIDSFETDRNMAVVIDVKIL